MTTVPAPDSVLSPRVAPRPALRPLGLPTEHGGWGFLFEPLVLGIAVAPSWGGALIAVAAIFGFLTRQPLKLAMQDLHRRRSYPRTAWCWKFVVLYGLGAATALAFAVTVSGPKILVPFAAVAPLAAVQVVYDARNKSRTLLAEICGATAMTSSAVAVGLAGGLSIGIASALAGVLAARAIPSIVYIRALIKRAHGQIAASWPAIVLHVIAIGVVALFAPWLAAVTMALLLLRATWALTHESPRAKTVGWREIAFGTLSVVMIAIGYSI